MSIFMQVWCKVLQLRFSVSGCVLDQGTMTQNPPNGAGTGAALQLVGRLLGPCHAVTIQGGGSSPVSTPEGFSQQLLGLNSCLLHLILTPWVVCRVEFAF